MRLALARHDEVLRSAVESHRGIVVKMMGDGMHAAFDDPLDAVSAALQLQQALADESRGVALRVRCGLHVGVVERRDSDLFGSVVNRTARIMGMAHGGQVLLSQAVAGLVHDRLPPSASLRDLGKVRLRDFAIPEQVYQLVHPSLRREFPALRALEETPNNLPRQATSFVGREDRAGRGPTPIGEPSVGDPHRPRRCRQDASLAASRVRVSIRLPRRDLVRRSRPALGGPTCRGGDCRCARAAVGCGQIAGIRTSDFPQGQEDSRHARQLRASRRCVCTACRCDHSRLSRSGAHGLEPRGACRSR